MRKLVSQEDHEICPPGSPAEFFQIRFDVGPTEAAGVSADREDYLADHQLDLR